MNHPAQIAAATAAMLALATTAAIAAPNAVVLQDSPVYATMTGNTVVNGLEEGDLVEVLQCGNIRCFVDIPGQDGWIRKDRLGPIGGSGSSQPGLNFGITLGPGGSGPSVSIGIGTGGGSISIGPGGSGPTTGPRVCLYEGQNYAGASRCFAPGSTIPNLTAVGWNDRARSLRTFGGASAQLCQHAGFAGTCAVYGSNKATLGLLNAQGSSIDVY